MGTLSRLHCMTFVWKMNCTLRCEPFGPNNSDVATSFCQPGFTLNGPHEYHCTAFLADGEGMGGQAGVVAWWKDRVGRGKEEERGEGGGWGRGGGGTQLECHRNDVMYKAIIPVFYHMKCAKYFFIIPD